MLGLAALEQTLPTGPPSTTIEKTHFLFSNLDQAHGPTSIVAFSSLAVLVLIRGLKVLIKSYYPGPAAGMEEIGHHPSSAVQTPGISEGNGTNGPPLPTSQPSTSTSTKPTPIIFKVLLALPEILLVILLTTLLSSLLSFSSPSSPWHIPVLGRITVSTHRDQLFSFPITKGNWKWVKKTTGTSVMIALIGYLDSVVAAKQNSDRFGYSVSSNREWVALGELLSLLPWLTI
jgi:MFS superfamily sulfate permease-like transporter